jgi:hypothetical protein
VPWSSECDTLHHSECNWMPGFPSLLHTSVEISTGVVWLDLPSPTFQCWVVCPVSGSTLIVVTEPDSPEECQKGELGVRMRGGLGFPSRYPLFVESG